MSISLSHRPDSPDSSSLPSFYSPFSHLPAELIQTIVTLAIPSASHSTTYGERLGTLCSLSLVSRLFRQVARPLLFAVLHFNKQETINSWNWRTAGRTELRCPTELVFEFSTIVGGFHESIIQFPSLQVLALADMKVDLDLALLLPLVNLRSLRLSKLQPKNPQLIKLPSVAELQLFTSHSLEVRDVLSPSTFPGLRTLAYSDEFYFPNWDISPLLAQFAPQLDVLSVDADLIPELSPETLRAIDHLTLFDLHAGMTDIPDVRNIRVMTEYDATYLTDTLQMLASDSLPLCQLLYLPHHSQIERSLVKRATNGDDVGTVLQRLSGICREQKVEIVREEEPRSWLFESRISFDFCKRRRRERLNRGTQ